jgi:hypothetical protein
VPCDDDGERFGLHGRISYAAAQRPSVRTEWVGEEYHIEVAGAVRETRVFGENLVLSRSISTTLDAPWLLIRDRVHNAGFAPTPLMLLYHVNLGWPLLDASSSLVLPACEDTPRDEDAAEGRDRARSFEAPIAGCREKVYLRDVPADSSGHVRVGLVNRALRPPLGVSLSYRKGDLPALVQWKMMGQGVYVCGIEPATCGVGGRAAAREAGTLAALGPGETRETEVRVEMLGSAEDIDAFQALVGRAAGGSERA